MKEFPIELKLQTLSPGVGEPGADFLVGLRVQKDGYEALLAPRLLVPLVAEWPFPQMLYLNEYTIVATRDSLYQVDGSLILGPTPSAGYPWSGTIVGDFIVLTNNKVVVAGRGYDLVLESTGLIPAGRTVLECGGQFIIGAPWMYGEHHPKAVAWGHVGAADFSIEEDNVAGIRFADVGDVLALMPQTFTTMAGLQKGFFALGTTGVTSFVVEGMPIVYKQKKLTNVGLYSQLAVTGTESKTFFVGTDRKLYVITERKAQPLGFEREFLGAGSEIVLSYDYTKDELWAAY